MPSALTVGVGGDEHAVLGVGVALVAVLPQVLLSRLRGDVRRADTPDGAVYYVPYVGTGRGKRYQIWVMGVCVCLKKKKTCVPTSSSSEQEDEYQQKEHLRRHPDQTSCCSSYYSCTQNSGGQARRRKNSSIASSSTAYPTGLFII